MFKQLKVVLITATMLVGGAAGIAAAQGGSKLDHAGRKAHMLEKFDANKDGKLDKDEKVAMHEARAAMKFQRLDKDGDGKLSLDEFKADNHRMGRMGHGKFRGGRGGGFDRGADRDEP